MVLNNGLKRLLAMVCLAIVSIENTWADRCQMTNPALELMPEIIVQFDKLANDDTDELVSLSAKLADNNRTRAAGFQHMCAAAVNKYLILFQFTSEQKPRFHMRNVEAALDIAFIDKHGHIVSIQTMLPYVIGRLERPTYYPNEPVVAALEAHAGFFVKHQITEHSKVTWNVKPTVGH